jgi:hypothetical protein
LSALFAGPCELPHPDVHLDKDGEISRLSVRCDRQSLGFGQKLIDVVSS